MKFFTRSVISPLCKRPRPTTFGLTVARCAIIGALGFAAHMQCAYAAQTSAVVSQQTGEQHVSASSQKSDKTLLTTSADSKATGKDSTSNTSSKDNTIDAVDRAAADAVSTLQTTPKRKLLAVSISSMDDDDNSSWIAYPDNRWCYKNPDGSWA